MRTDVMTQDRRSAADGRRGDGPRADGPRADGHGTQTVPDSRRAPRPARRPRPDRPASPVHPASPVRPAGPGRPGRTVRTGGPARDSARRQQARAGQVGRTSFVLLVLGLLGGGLICLLVVNTTLAANSIEITRLQDGNTANSHLVEQLQQQVATDRSAAVIAKEAERLGMRPDPLLTFVDLAAHKIRVKHGHRS